jgi:hypothetical protein
MGRAGGVFGGKRPRRALLSYACHPRQGQPRSMFFKHPRVTFHLPFIIPFSIRSSFASISENGPSTTFFINTEKGNPETQKKATFQPP